MEKLKLFLITSALALWLGRDAGAALEAKLTVVTADDKDAGPLTITVGKLALGGLKSEGMPGGGVSLRAWVTKVVK